MKYCVVSLLVSWGLLFLEWCPCNWRHSKNNRPNWPAILLLYISNRNIYSKKKAPAPPKIFIEIFLFTKTTRCTQNSRVRQDRASEERGARQRFNDELLNFCRAKWVQTRKLKDSSALLDLCWAISKRQLTLIKFSNAFPKVYHKFIRESLF